MSDKFNKKSIISGLGWTTISTITNGLVQILRLSILSRFLSKEDFGIVAILTLILGLTQVFSDMGFSAAIMSQKKIEKRNFLSLYWLQFLVFTFMMLSISLCSPFIANYYDSPILSKLVPIMMSELFFVSLGKLYDTVLQKNMEFRTIAIRNIVTASLSLFIAIILAIQGYGVYSLVISTVSQTAMVNIWNLKAGQNHYKLSMQKIDFKQAKELMKVGYYQMGTQIVDYFASKLDIIVISSTLGVGALGVYNLSKELILKFVIIINTISNRVMLPVFTNYQDDIEELKRIFVLCLKKMALFNAPIVGFVILFCNYIVKIFYGNAFLEAIPIVQILAIWSLFVVFGQPNSLLAIATKKTNISFWYTIVRLVIMYIMLTLFGRFSLFASAITVTAIYVIMFFVNWFMLVRKCIYLSFIEYLLIFKKACGVITLIVCSLFFIRTALMYFNINTDVTNVIILAIYISTIIVFLYFSEKDTIYQYLKR